MANLKEIAREYLEISGYDGLWNDMAECGCELDDLMPCDEPSPNCEPGYKVKCVPEECPNGGGCEFHIGPKETEGTEGDESLS